MTQEGAPRFDADSTEGRILLGLRAGEIETVACNERFSGFSSAIGKLVGRRLVEKTDGGYRITEAGRAACPFRNPKAATAAEPEIFTMPKENCLSRSRVFDAICAAGPDGITTPALCELLDADISSIKNHVHFLTREPGAVVQRPRRGLFVASRFLDATVPTDAEIDACVAAMAPEPLASPPDFTAGGGTPDDDVVIYGIDGPGFALWSNGSLSIVSNNVTVELDPGAFRALRAYLGLFSGEAA